MLDGVEIRALRWPLDKVDLVATEVFLSDTWRMLGVVVLLPEEVRVGRAALLSWRLEETANDLDVDLVCLGPSIDHRRLSSQTHPDHALTAVDSLERRQQVLTFPFFWKSWYGDSSENAQESQNSAGLSMYLRAKVRQATRSFSEMWVCLRSERWYAADFQAAGGPT